MTKRRLPHESITEDRVVALCMEAMRTAENPGICLACGDQADGCEPDAENYTCESCGESCVMGAEQILISGAYHPDKPERTGHRTRTRTTKAVDDINTAHDRDHIDDIIDIEDET